MWHEARRARHKWGAEPRAEIEWMSDATTSTRTLPEPVRSYIWNAALVETTSIASHPQKKSTDAQ